MIIYNTTFHVDEEIHKEFVEYILQHFIPMSTRSRLLSSARLSKVHGQEENDGLSFALEFQVADIDTLERWNNEESRLIYTPLLEKFKEKVAGFSTIMETISY